MMNYEGHADEARWREIAAGPFALRSPPRRRQAIGAIELAARSFGQMIACQLRLVALAEWSFRPDAHQTLERREGLADVFAALIRFPGAAHGPYIKVRNNFRTQAGILSGTLSGKIGPIGAVLCTFDNKTE